MSLVVIDPEDLERAGGVLDHAAREYHALAGELRAAAAALPNPVVVWASYECTRVTAGLHAEAEALGSMAAKLRERAREARTADAPDRRRGPRPPSWPRSPLATGDVQPTPEDYVRGLRESVRIGLVAGPSGVRLGLSRAGASGGVAGKGSGAGGALAAGLLVLGAIWLIIQGQGGTGDQSQSDTRSKTEPTTSPTSAPSPCPVDPTPRPTDNVKEALNQKHLDAARRELMGEVVKTKRDGTSFDHVTEVKNAQASLRKRINDLKRRLGYLRCPPEERAAAEQELSEASKLLDQSEWYVPPGS
jgi:hypothetical protein